VAGMPLQITSRGGSIRKNSEGVRGIYNSCVCTRRFHMLLLYCNKLSDLLQ